jgi:hypothetical protein
MRGPETPDVLLKASDRISRSMIWSVMHKHEAPAGEAAGLEEDAAVEERTLTPVRLGLRGTPVAAPRRAR